MFYVKAIFTENGGDPSTGLSPVVTIIDLSNGNILINSQLMSESGYGAYRYPYPTFDPAISYHVIVDAQNRDIDGRGYAYGGNEMFTEEFINLLSNSIVEKIEEGEIWGGYPL